MFLWWTCILYTSLIFVCVRVSSAVYLLCFLDICRIGSVLVHMSQLWCSWLHVVLKNRLRSRTRMQNVRSHVVRETVRSESNRPRVLREQKVLPEVRNRPLLLREFFSFSTFEKLLRIQWGILPFYPFNFRYTYKTKLMFEKMSQLEVGVLWVARRYRFRNLRFKHRGMQLGM